MHLLAKINYGHWDPGFELLSKSFIGEPRKAA